MSKKICKFETCDRQSHAFGYCIQHARQYKQGKTLTPLRRWVRQQVLANGHRQCTRCEYFKKPDDFYDLPNGKKRARCIECEISLAIERKHRNEEAA